MKKYATFNKNGDISTIITTNTDQLPGEDYIEVSSELNPNTDTHFVDVETHTIKERKKIDFDVSYSTLTAIIDGLPKESKVFTCGQEILVDDGTLTITLDLPELINVTIDAGPQYIKEDMEIQIG